MIAFLEINRDQSLWLSVVLEMNHDSGATHDIYDWILNQPDCDAQVANWAYSLLEGPYFCGKDKGDKFAENSGALRPLRTIAQRDAAGQHFVVGLMHIKANNDPLFRLDTMLLRSQQSLDELAEDQEPLVAIPKTLLASFDNGTDPVASYYVHECGVAVVPKGHEVAIL